MATVQTRERSTSVKKPFGWIQRLYRKSSPQDFGEQGRTLTPVSTTEGAPFLGIGTSPDEPGAGNDMSSLRPTISTRAPSLAQSTISNAAVRNVEAISPRVDVFDAGDPPHGFASTRTVDTLQATSQSTSVKPTNSAVERRHSRTAAEIRTSCPVTSSRPSDEIGSGPAYATSMNSSNRSSIPSVFTTKTAETQPTMTNFPHPGSIVSSRTGGGVGANDNASMLTLASSSKGPRRRRLSTDTNCSVFALAPASARASFESSRTGLTEARRTATANSNFLIFADDGGTTGPHKPSGRLWDAASSRRSMSGLSTKSDTLTVGSSMT